LPEKLLVVSCSARMLAQSAARAGIRVVALDHYADADTRAFSAHAQAVPFTDGAFEPQALLDAACKFAPDRDFPLVYGSGLDSQPELLEALGRSREVIGNSPAIQRLFRSPRSFFELLRQCGVPYPEIRHERPENGQKWLIKSGCSEGGKRVRFCAQDQGGAEDYYQRWVCGKTYSALFLADSDTAKVIGFNTLWTTGFSLRPFLFAGAMSYAPLSPAQQQQIEDHIAALVKVGGIRGLNSLDFMVTHDGELQVLEVNARPSATMALYDEDTPGGLLAAHIRACRGELKLDVAAAKVRAFRVYFAPRRIVAMPIADWPSWCADLPVAGSIVEPGQPLCTILAEGDHPADVERLLRQRLGHISATWPTTTYPI
jgi:predicted ATP-grasp superfamily ATP-dependent carboligase